MAAFGRHPSSHPDPAHARWRHHAGCRGPDRTARAVRHQGYLAANPHGHGRFAVRIARRVRTGWTVAAVEPLLRKGLGTGRGSARYPSAERGYSGEAGQQPGQSQGGGGCGPRHSRRHARSQAARRQAGTGRWADPGIRRRSAARRQRPADRARRDRCPAGRGSAARTQHRAGRGGRGEDPVPGQHVLRIPHAADLDRRICRTAASRGGGRVERAGPGIHRRDPRFGRAADRADRNGAGPCPERGRPTAAGARKAGLVRFRHRGRARAGRRDRGGGPDAGPARIEGGGQHRRRSQAPVARPGSFAGQCHRRLAAQGPHPRRRGAGEGQRAHRDFRQRAGNGRCHSGARAGAGEWQGG